jgi:hypothetical protein
MGAIAEIEIQNCAIDIVGACRIESLNERSSLVEHLHCTEASKNVSNDCRPH